MKRVLLLPLTVLTGCETVLDYANIDGGANGTNLLFIMTDQQRFDALAIAGKFDFLQTPNLDKLARSGAYFTNAYTPCAVSGPARSSILTGLMVEKTGVLSNELTAKNPVLNNFTTKETFDQILSRKGYYTDYFGKWHAPIGWTNCYETFGYVKKNDLYSYTLNDNIYYQEAVSEYSNWVEGALFDKTMHKLYYHPDPIDRRVVYGYDPETGCLYPEEEARRASSQPDSHGELILPDEMSITAYQASRTIEAIKSASKSGKPFSITCSFHHPHAPMLPTKKYHDMYDVESMPIPTSINDAMVDSPYINQNGRNIFTEYSDPKLIKYMIANYFGLVTEIDDWVGEIMQTLSDVGELNNTLVIFTSDHGEMLGSHGMREKNVFLEESAHVPLIISYPGVIAPQTFESNTSTLDLFPTIMSYLGVECDDRDGRTLRPYLEGNDTKESIAVTEWLYNDLKQPTHMIVKDNMKLFMPYSNDSNMQPVLYNLDQDSHELNNLIGRSNATRDQNIELANQLRDEMVEWLDERNSRYTEQIREYTFND